MSFHRDRHTVLAGNVANVDTPGYRPLDLERLPASAAISLEIAETDEGHQQLAQVSDPTLRFDDSGESQGIDGNAVSLERELAKIDANRVRYGTSAELTSRRIALLKYAASDGNS